MNLQSFIQMSKLTTKVCINEENSRRNVFEEFTARRRLPFKCKRNLLRLLFLLPSITIFLSGSIFFPKAFESKNSSTGLHEGSLRHFSSGKPNTMLKTKTLYESLQILSYAPTIYNRPDSRHFVPYTHSFRTKVLKVYITKILAELNMGSLGMRQNKLKLIEAYRFTYGLRDVNSLESVHLQS